MFDPSNFKRISISSTVSKIFEFVLLKGFLSDLEEKIHPLQGGFRKGYGTSHTSFILQEAIRSCKQQKQICYMAFLDARKAFDTVWHNGLFYKLRKYF